MCRNEGQTLAARTTHAPCRLATRRARRCRCCETSAASGPAVEAGHGGSAVPPRALLISRTSLRPSGTHTPSRGRVIETPLPVRVPPLGLLCADDGGDDQFGAITRATSTLLPGRLKSELAGQPGRNFERRRPQFRVCAVPRSWSAGRVIRIRVRRTVPYESTIRRWSPTGVARGTDAGVAALRAPRWVRYRRSMVEQGDN